MDKVIDRVFRFIEMIGITALFKAVLVPAYPTWGGVIVNIMIAMSALYLIYPIMPLTIKAIIDRSEGIARELFYTVVFVALFSSIQIFLLDPFVATVSDLIKKSISAAK